MIIPLVPNAPMVPSAELDAWLDDARRVEAVHRAMMAWLRARLPGYPMLLVPQLVQGTPLTTDEYTYRLPWTRQELAVGYQFQEPPTEGLRLLGATTKQAKRTGEAARHLASALVETQEWQRFQSSNAALTSDDRGELRRVRKTVSDALKPSALDTYEPDLLLPRDAYRRRVVAEAVSAMAGRAREYVDAFDAAERLLELAGSDVLGQLAVYGTVGLVGVSELSANGAGPGTVEFNFMNDAHVSPGAVCWLDDPLLPDAIHLTGSTMSFDQMTGVRWRATGRVLAGTAAIWPRADPPSQRL